MTSDPIVRLADAIRLGTPDGVADALTSAGYDASTAPTAWPDLARASLDALAMLASSSGALTHEQIRSIALLAASVTPALRAQCAAQLRAIAASVPPEAIDRLRAESSPHARAGAGQLAQLLETETILEAPAGLQAPFGEEPPPVPAARTEESVLSSDDGIVDALADPSLAVRLEAISACAGGPYTDRVLRALAAVAAEDAFSGARVAAIEALRSAPPEWRRYVACVSLESGDDDVEAAAAHLLDAADDDDAVLAARFVRSCSEAAALRAAAALSTRDSSQSVALLWAALPDALAPVRREVVSRLRAIDERAVRVLMKLALQSNTVEQRIVGLAVLGEFTDEDSQPLVDALTDPSHDVRLTALHAFAQRSSADALDAIGGRVLDPRPEVRDAAVEVLRDSRHATALPYLLTAAGDPVESVRDAARSAIRNMATPHIVDSIIHAMRTPGTESTAGELLVELGEAAVPALIVAFDGADAAHRQRIGEILQAIGGSRHVRESLGDPDPVVRRRAADAVAAMGGRDATSTLLSLLHDPEPGVRRHVVELVAEIHDAGAASELELASLREPHPSVAAAMKQAVERMTSADRSSRQEELNA